MKSENKRLVGMGIAATLCATLGSTAWAQKVFRCGNEYTNNTARIEQGGCTPLTGGNVTIVRGGTIRTSMVKRSYSAGAPSAQPIPNTSSSSDAPKVVEDSAQRTRDAGSRGILQTELDKATQKLAELQKEYNKGEPEIMGPEHRNHQNYLDRVAELKSSIARTESDIQGLKRELGRSGG